MGKLNGFREYIREDELYKSVSSRITNYADFTIPLSKNEIENQAARCMDCGIPFCHSGCPLGNFIPDFNDAVYNKEWERALEILHSTNNFPEFTGRLCPAPCEKSCVLGIIDEPVSIENIEKNLAEEGFKNGWIVPHQNNTKTGKRIAIIGSGPAGLAAAQQLNRVGHFVSVLERDDELGGLLRYGIPDFKLDKKIIDRRIEILRKEGIEFRTNKNVGVNYDIKHLETFDIIILCGGASVKRVLPIKNSNCQGVVQAMDFLKQQNKINANKVLKDDKFITAKDKNVIVIGGGDTGSDCIGTAIRQGAKSVINFEIMSKPPKERSLKTPWPFWPLQLKNTSSHEESENQRHWLISTKEFITDECNNLRAIKTVNVEWLNNNGEMFLKEIEGTEKVWDCELVLLALGFSGTETSLADKLGVELDSRGNIQSNNYQTNKSNIFAAGDMRRGQSLIVWAISEGRECAKKVNEYLMGSSNLPTKGDGDMVTA